MDIKEWLKQNTGVRRNKFALLLGLILFPFILLAGLYQLYLNIDALETTSLRNVIILNAGEVQVVTAHHAQVAFSRQLQDWSRVGTPGDGQGRYWSEFQRAEGEVRQALQEMQASALAAHDEGGAADIESAIEAQRRLGRRYRDAYAALARKADKAAATRFTRGMREEEEAFAAILEQLSLEAERDYKSISARVVVAQSGDIENVQGRVELDLIVITLLILVEGLVILRTINKGTRELDQLAQESEKTVYHLAYSDSLTELPNRRLFQDRLGHAIAQSNRTNRWRALMFMDMDNFKQLNDTKGHAMGDLLLIEVAKRLKGCVRASDTVARLGGDEFVALLGELSEDEESASEQALMIAEKISKALSEPYQLGHFIYNCSASIGVTMFSSAGVSIEEVHKRADAAMYQAKNAGRNAIRFYDPQTQAALEARSELEHALRTAIDQHQLRLYLQVQVDEHSRPVGAEALLRWLHPQLGMVFPGQFIDIAEETGLIVPIGKWILESACRQIKAWEGDPRVRDLQIAVNVSARQFYQPNFVAMVAEVVRQAGINPAHLKLELTESMVLDDVEDTVLKMNALKKVGVRFSMDDFGTGYSSLAYLTQLPLNQLKVDQSFVRNIGVKPSDSVIVQTIIGMAHNLNIESIAEGVETQAQRDFLEKAGCRLYQGYLFGRPVPMDKFVDALVEMGV